MHLKTVAISTSGRSIGVARVIAKADRPRSGRASADEVRQRREPGVAAARRPPDVSRSLRLV